MPAGRSRRRFLRTGLALATFAVAGCTGDADRSDSPAATRSPTTETPRDSSSGDSGVTATRLADGFASPVGVEFAPGRTEPFVVDQPGRVYRVDDGGSRPYLDLRDRVVDISGYDERGLLGLAFHPQFEENGRLFVRYSAPRRAGTPSGYSHTFVLSELTVDPVSDLPDVAERTLLEIPQPQSNHNAGSVLFGPDGFLYVGTGDGGGANDVGTGHVTDWYDAVGGGNGQDVRENLLGSVLRLDVDTDEPYGIPDDNPLVGRAGLDEQYAWGFRNPWRMSFDGSDLYVADVGQNAFEEVSLVERGGNYGWNVREGTHCFQAGDDCPTATPEGDPLHGPVVEYAHDADRGPSGVAVIGGYRYDGPLAALDGTYVFADWRAQGTIFTATPSAERPWETAVVPVDGLDPFVLAFGFDGADLYAATASEAGVGGSDGSVVRLS